MRAVLLASVIALSGCNVSIGSLQARATDEWIRSYALAAGGEVQIVNTNGKIEVEGVDGNMVDVRAERVARATTEAAAKELLPRITIKEDIRPDRVSIEAERLQGLLIGVGVEVNYRVRVPRTAVVRLRGTNGIVTATGITRRVVATTTNGNVTVSDMSGGVEARATNGRVVVELASLGADDPIDVSTTNGSVRLQMPSTAKADVSASCTNGTIEIDGFTFEPVGEQSRRRVRGRLNGGGTPVSVTTTNGTIRVSGR